MKANELGKIAFPVLLLATGLAVAKESSQSVAASTTKDGSSMSARRATGPNATKADNGSTRANVNPDTGSGEAKDPYAVPLFQGAKPLIRP